VLHQVAIRDHDDLLAARELVRSVARDAGCNPVVETRLVAGLSDLIERFYSGASGKLVIRTEDDLLEAILEHGDDEADSNPCPDAEQVLLAIGSIRYLWDEVDVCPACDRGLKVVLRAWLR
jgi:hypothetical protein